MGMSKAVIEICVKDGFPNKLIIESLRDLGVDDLEIHEILKDDHDLSFYQFIFTGLNLDDWLNKKINQMRFKILS